MQRLLDVLQVLFYVVAILVMVAMGGYGLMVLHALNTHLTHWRVSP